MIADYTKLLVAIDCFVDRLKDEGFSDADITEALTDYTELAVELADVNG